MAYPTFPVILISPTYDISTYANDASGNLSDTGIGIPPNTAINVLSAYTPDGLNYWLTAEMPNTGSIVVQQVTLAYQDNMWRDTSGNYWNIDKQAVAQASNQSVVTDLGQNIAAFGNGVKTAVENVASAVTPDFVKNWWNGLTADVQAAFWVVTGIVAILVVGYIFKTFLKKK